jgi:tetratricopeptide (TPR) repeat protein
VRRALIPFSLAILCFLAFGLRVPGWTLLIAALIVPGFYAWSAIYVTKNLRPFEAEFNSRLTHGDVDGLWALYRDARLLRYLAPSWMMLAKLGLILSLRGEFKAANGVLEEAYELSPRRRRVDLLGPLARTKYELGEFGALQEIASQWRARSLFPGSANVYLAAAYVEDPREENEQARPLLEEIQSGLPAGEARLAATLTKRIGD